ncbi:C10 family peptidase [Mesoterricola sediminis]|uniref:Immunoglobulin domain-containing protein n=1 Tax=Mesoterricola sediminis TaxID=2927980 RepID=A0AA48KB45_9BACT|nr:C10 family peptidase [Mesoterricola sediminis]BDU75739.1 hypothetical protein METESE_06970 [Mesoterricola sediminis]
MSTTSLLVRRSSLGLALAAGAALLADPVTAYQARMAADAWLQSAPAPLGLKVGAHVAEVISHGDALGRVLFHEARLAGGGFLVLAADDRLEPIVALSEAPALETGEESHLYLMLRRDLGARLNRLDRLGKGPGAWPEAVARSASRWQALVAGPSIETSLVSVTDVRVQPLLQSTWSQGNAGGQYTYNMFTPNNYVCGCVATSMSQLMRFHTWPTAGIGVKTFTVKVDGVSRSLTTRGGDGSGGAYLWSSMPLSPGYTTLEGERAMIGALTYDAGVSVNMSYAADGSGASDHTAATQLKGTFKYANAVFGSNGGELTGQGLEAMVIPGLEAGYPVILGISGDKGGHSIVCDGYGYSGATRYYHLNLGWGGSYNAWYALPTIDSSPSFDLVDDCIYNVFPSGTGEILSGRVTDAAGAPVAGVSVTDGTVTAVTSATGVYGLKGLTPGVHTVTASGGGAAWPTAVRILSASADYGTAGNLWGVDLVQGSGATPTIAPAPASTEVKVGGTVTFTAGATGLGPLHFAWTRNGAPVGTDAPQYTLTGAALADDQASIGLRVTGTQGAADAPPATLSVVRLYNGTFEHGADGWNLWANGVVLGTGWYTEIDPHAGKQWLCLGDWTSTCTDFAMQDVPLPDAGSIGLSFWMGILNKSATPAAASNLFKVKVLDATGATLATLASADNTGAQTSGGKVTWKAYGPYDLTPWRGQTVRLRFESYQPGGDNTGTVFALDDIALTLLAGPRASLPATPLTLATGARTPFTATVTGFTSDNRVDWSVTPGGGTFDPVRTAGDGAATTQFTAGSAAGVFTVSATPVEPGGAAATRSVILMDPATIPVSVTPATALAALAQPVSLTATVGTLTDGTVTWTCSGGAFTSTGANAAAWSSATPGTFTVTATSNGAPTRSAAAQITVVDLAAVNLAISPASVILRPGLSQAFTCTGDLGYGVDWSLTSPALHVDTGLSTTVTVPSTVPLTTATYTLTAVHKASASRSATATLTVKGIDLNGDGAADPRDLLLLAAEWGKPASSPANFKGSGTVDDTDLATLLNEIK